MSRMAKGKKISVLDATKGFYQIILDEESSRLCTFNTCFGRYRYKRLPFGITSASEIFHREVNSIIQGLEGVENFVDDIVVWGETQREHDDRLKQVLDRCRKHNLKLNMEKCKFNQTEVKYLGHIIGNGLIKPDDEKVRAVVEMATPEDKKAVQRFLGMVTYVAKFIPNLSEISAPLRDVIKNNVEFEWSYAQEAAYTKLKQVISQAPVLKMYDINKPVTISVDASQNGMGAVLLQDGKPVEYASRALTATQKSYAQIEKELLAIVFGCERFQQYICYKDTTVETDHKPLESICDKPLSNAPTRMQRLLLKLQKYNPKVVYKPGKYMYVADTLSRAYSKDTFTDHDGDVEEQVHAIMETLPVSEDKTEQLRQTTSRDQTMIRLVNAIKDGWPNHKYACPLEIREFWPYRDELTVTDGIVFKGENIMVPPSMRPEMLQRIHMGHMGIEKSKQRARDVLFWPGMSKQIEDLVGMCGTCRAHRNALQREPMQPHDVPVQPWEKVGTDLFSYKGKDYLLIVDYYSRFFEVVKLPDTRAATIVTNTKSIFSRHGIPKIVMSDNGPQYTSGEYKSFSEAWEFSHETSSPRYPQSNGLAERTVQTVKNILTKAEESNRDPYLAILEYRNTPIDDIASPAQLLMSRRLRSIIPTTTRQLKPMIVPAQHAWNKLQCKQNKQKHYYDTRAKSSATHNLQSGDKVFIKVKPDGQWRPGIINSHAGTPRSYHV